MNEREGTAMWHQGYDEVCRRHPDVAAVYESTSGRLAVLLRHALAPGADERPLWFRDTRRSARALIADLRAAGLGADISVVLLQGRPLPEIARVVRNWDRRYDRTPASAGRARVESPWTADGRPPMAGLTAWYRDMAPSWLAAEPLTRRKLILRTHRWIVDDVLVPMSRGEPAHVVDLQPGGRLAWMLLRILPRGDVRPWKGWIRLVLADLQRAMTWPQARRSEAWARWLFLIPYSVPVSRPRPAAADGLRAALGD